MGERSKDILESAGTAVEFSASVTSAEELIHLYGRDLDGKKLLFVRGDSSMRTIPTLLNGRSNVDEVVVYRTVRIEPDRSEIDSIRRQLAEHEFDWICFFSPSGVGAFCDLFGKEAKTHIAVIGKTTALTAAENGLNVEFVAKRPGDFATEFAAHLNGI